MRSLDSAIPSDIASGAEFYRALFERSLDCLYIHDFEGNFLDANPAALSLLGYVREEVPGLSFTDFLSANQIPIAMRAMAELRKTGTQKEIVEFRMRCKNGSFVDVEAKASVLVHDGKQQAILGVARDITGRKRAEQELAASEERFRQIAEIAGDSIWEVDANGLYLFISPAVEKILGYPPADVIGKMHFHDLYAPEVREEIKAASLLLFALHKSFRDRLIPHVRRDGRIVLLEISGVPVLDAAGNLIAYRGVARDVTERKRAEEELETSEEQFRAIFEEAPIACIEINRQGVVERANMAAGEFLGVDPSFLIEHLAVCRSGATAGKPGKHRAKDDRPAAAQAIHPPVCTRGWDACDRRGPRQVHPGQIGSGCRD